jgi:c-di-GMP-binding flagellar brake protein YcgR
MSEMLEIRKEQRADYRLPIVMPVSVVRHITNNYNYPIEGQTVNISGGGMFLTVGEEIGINEKVALTFDMGETETVEGIVVRYEKINNLYNISVQFIF